ncbi:hypothetical protein [Phaeobacter italicus]|jgi:hypothetical protein|uniref:hypothetical protein n=1 Tax=Phaeobacter italicus TaxID=481446 RepID=UPI002FDCC1BB
MNPETATLRSSDLCALLGVPHRSLWRWLSAPYPPHHFSETAPRGRTYALPEIVARLRKRRDWGLSGEGLARVLAFDTETRAARQADCLWLGDDAQGRAASFFAALTGEETERARDVMKTMRNAAAAAGLPAISRMGQIALIQPGSVRFILSGEADELPAGDAGWQSFAKAIWAVNPSENYEVAA